MLNLPPPPSPPIQSQQTLAELAAYYRQLVEYYQQAAALATQQLFHVEALLNPIQTLDAETSTQRQLALPTVENHDNAFMEAQLLVSSPRELKSAEELETQTYTDAAAENAKAYQAITKILAANKGKILHIDYLIWELYGKLDDEVQLALKTEVEKTLFEGEKRGFWDAIVDSPGCWTLDLSDFPDLAPSSSKKSESKQKNDKTHKKSREAHSNLSRFPYSENLEAYVTLDVAIEECLILHYPQTMNADRILQWLYPHELSPQDRKQVRAAIMNMLNKGNATKGWKRVKTGQYIWDAS